MAVALAVPHPGDASHAETGVERAVGAETGDDRPAIHPPRPATTIWPSGWVTRARAGPADGSRSRPPVPNVESGVPSGA